jgi:recombinational DNA repair protein (RecF pathway)
MHDRSATQDKHCARCGQTLTTSLLFRDGLFWHESCWHEGARLLANAERLARALTPTLGLQERRTPE